MKNLIAVLLLVFVGTAQAYELNDVQVVRYGERYLITFDVNMDASIDGIKAVVNDFENAAMLTPAVKSTEVYRYDDDTVRVTAVMRPCVYIFCRTMTKLSIVRINEDDIQMFGVEDAGSFRNTRESLKFESVDSGTRMRYRGDISPKFFLPQWLGVKFIRGTIRKYLDEILTNIETEANAGV